MNLRICLLVLLFPLVSLLAIPTYGQNARPGRPGGGKGGNPTAVVKGNVVDEAGKPVYFAVVVLCDPIDSLSFAGKNTDEAGKFRFRTRPGKHLLKVSYLGYEDLWKPVEKLPGAPLDVGRLELSPSSLEIGKVDIEAERNQMEFKLDKRVYNVSKDLVNAGASAQEILENVPSVTVDVEGNVALRGSQGVQILIDGKPSGLIGIRDQNGLRNIQGSLIDRVEVITNPSSKYDAEGEAGIINIVLKKKRQKGLNGSFDLSAGYPHLYSGGLNLNWRKKKINLFTNGSLRFRKAPGGGTFYQEFGEGANLLIYESTTERSRGGINGQFQLGTDIFLDKYNTITFSGLYQGSRGNNFSSILYEDFNADGELLRSSTRTDNELEPGTDVEANLNYTRKFTQKDRVWTVDLKYSLNDDTENNEYRETYSDGTPDLIQRGLNTEDQVSYLFQTDYYHPVGKNGKIETGLKATLRGISNDFTVEELISSGEWLALSDFDNQLRYRENIYAGYAIYGNEIKRFSYQAGLRYEISDIGTELVETNEVNDRNYSNLFPSAAVAYKLSDKHQLQASYSRRISRPRFRSLLPFFTYSNNRVIYQGNPDLDPELTDSYELGYLSYFDKGSVLSSVYYRYGTNVVQRLTLVDEFGIANLLPVNLGFRNSYGVEFNMNYDLFKWWQMTANVNFFRAITSGEYEGVSYDADAITLTTRSSAKFTLPKNIRLQTSVNYRAPRITPQGRSLSVTSWDAGASLRVWKNKGSFTFNVRDILNTRKRRAITEGEDFYSELTFQWRRTQMTLSFNYRLNQSGPQKRRRTPQFQNGGEDF